MRRETSRVSVLMCPFCVRELLASATTPGRRVSRGRPTPETVAAHPALLANRLGERLARSGLAVANISLVDGSRAPS